MLEKCGKQKADCNIFLPSGLCCFRHKGRGTEGGLCFWRSSAKLLITHWLCLSQWYFPLSWPKPCVASPVHLHTWLRGSIAKPSHSDWFKKTKSKKKKTDTTSFFCCSSGKKKQKKQQTTHFLTNENETPASSDCGVAESTFPFSFSHPVCLHWIWHRGGKNEFWF